jgi:hypothetical protein
MQLLLGTKFFVTDANLVFAALYGKILTQNKQQSIIYIRKMGMERVDCDKRLSGLSQSLCT